VVDEEKHPGAKRFKRRRGDCEALFGCRKLFDFVKVEGFDEVVASGKVAIEGWRCHQSRDIKRANTAFLTIVDQGTRGLKAAVEGSPYS
jgi:hypothetical protein